jgi:DNA topoisomerase-2
MWHGLLSTFMHAGLTKLDDANDAGGRNSDQCTLILTEGDSAKSLVIAGMSVAGRDKFGVFPLRPVPLSTLLCLHGTLCSGRGCAWLQQHA